MQIHLIRHGEVDNPDHIVYGSLAGFTLSARGRGQAVRTGRYLARFPISQIVASPLERAVDTSALLTPTADIPIDIDDRLTEWKLSTRWAGEAWEDLNRVFPGELDAYLADPTDLPFAPESVADIAARVSAAVGAWVADTDEDSDVVFVSHQDPIHAARLELTGTGFATFNRDKPEHCSVTTLAKVGRSWSMVEYWAPTQ
jgi:broad specificity phosphatase PhoE